MGLTKFTADNFQEPVPVELGDLYQDQIFLYYTVLTIYQLSTVHPYGLDKERNKIYNSQPTGQIRLRGALMQHPDVVKAFNCKPGDQMYLKKKMQIDLLGSDKA